MVHLQQKQVWGLLIVIAFSFWLTLWLPITGEEGVYTNAAIEMLFTKQYKFATLYGHVYPRPPLFNWLIALVTNFTPSLNAVLAARIVTMLATFATAAGLFYFTKKLFNSPVAIISLLVFLSGDVLMKRGWLAYSDPLFAMFVFASTALLLLAVVNNRTWLLLCANLMLFCAFLTKVPTAYVFYGSAAIVLLCSKPHATILLRPASIFYHLIGLALPFFWQHLINSGNNVALAMHDIHRMLTYNFAITAYIKNISLFPFKVIAALLPGSIIALGCYALAYQRNLNMHNQHIKRIALFSLLMLMPYWLSTNSHVRYLLPVTPWLSILIGYTIWQYCSLTSNKPLKIFIFFLAATIALKYLFVSWWLPRTQLARYGDPTAIAIDALAIGKNQLSITADDSAGLRVAAAVNQLQQEPILRHRNKFIIAREPLIDSATLVKSYALGKDRLYLHEALDLNTNVD